MFFKLQVLPDLLLHFFLVFFHIGALVYQIAGNSLVLLLNYLSLFFLEMPVAPGDMLEGCEVSLIILDVGVNFPYFLQQHSILSFDLSGTFIGSECFCC